MADAPVLTAVVKRDGLNHRKPTKRLTAEEIGLMLKLRQDGLSQPQIAQRLDCDQAAVSRWLAKLTDTSEVAKSYLRGSALRMAENIVRKGLPRDHVATLRGIGVLADETTSGNLIIQIGIKDSEVTFASQPSAVTQDFHKLTADTESDN